MKWIKGRNGLPSLFKKVKWRNADGGNIPLGEATPLEHYQRTGGTIRMRLYQWDSFIRSTGKSQTTFK